MSQQDSIAKNFYIELFYNGILSEFNIQNALFGNAYGFHLDGNKLVFEGIEDFNFEGKLLINVKTEQPTSLSIGIIINDIDYGLTIIETEANKFQTVITPFNIILTAGCHIDLFASVPITAKDLMLVLSRKN